MGVIHLPDDAFEKEVTDSKGVVLVDFWASWCGPCMMLGPIIDELSNEYEGKVKFCKINVDECPTTSESHNIMSVPTVMIFKDGKQVETIIGLRNKDAYKQVIDQYV